MGQCLSPRDASLKDNERMSDLIMSDNLQESRTISRFSTSIAVYWNKYLIFSLELETSAEDLYLDDVREELLKDKRNRNIFTHLPFYFLDKKHKLVKKELEHEFCINDICGKELDNINININHYSLFVLFKSNNISITLINLLTSLTLLILNLFRQIF